jgi:alpha-tubulin suppressor-like RCC1 family protein
MVRRLFVLSLPLVAVAAAVASACTGDDPVSPAVTDDAAVSGADSSGPTPGSDGSVVGSDGGTDAGGRTFVSAATGGLVSCAVDTSGTVWCWGANTWGELGDTNFTIRPVASRVPGLPKMLSVAVGATHVCAVSATHEVWCWGESTHGELGHDPAADLACNGAKCNPTPKVVTDLAADVVVTLAGTTCALSTSHDVFCWGDDSTALLGAGLDGGGGLTTAPLPGTQSFTPVRVLGLPAGGVSTIDGASWPGHAMCATTNTGGVLCWGENPWGGAGHEPSLDNDHSAASGDCASGCNATPLSPHHQNPFPEGGPLDDGPVIPAARGAAGGWASCAVMIDLSAVECWGANFCDQMATLPGDPAFTDTHARFARRTVGNGVASIHVGEAICALMLNNQVMCWGNDGAGVVGSSVNQACRSDDGTPSIGTATAFTRPAFRAKTLSLSRNAAVAVDLDGHVLAWGQNSFGQLGHEPGMAGDDTQAGNRNPVPQRVEGLDVP